MSDVVFPATNVLYGGGTPVSVSESSSLACDGILESDSHSELVIQGCER